MHYHINKKPRQHHPEHIAIGFLILLLGIAIGTTAANYFISHVMVQPDKEVRK